MYAIACMSSERTLDTIRDAALRTATGAFRTSPMSSIIMDVNEPPLALRRCVLIMRYACKLRQFLDHQTYEYVFSGRQLAVFETSERLRAVSFCVRVPKLLLEAIFVCEDLHPFLSSVSLHGNCRSLFHWQHIISPRCQFQSHVLERVFLC